jgi:hypothetical protein
VYGEKKKLGQLLMKNDASLSALICSAWAKNRRRAVNQSCLLDGWLKNSPICRNIEATMYFFLVSLNSVRFSFRSQERESRSLLEPRAR